MMTVRRMKEPSRKETGPGPEPEAKLDSKVLQATAEYIAAAKERIL
jgi:hypothetical protein